MKSTLFVLVFAVAAVISCASHADNTLFPEGKLSCRSSVGETSLEIAKGRTGKITVGLSIKKGHELAHLKIADSAVATLGLGHDSSSFSNEKLYPSLTFQGKDEITDRTVTWTLTYLGIRRIMTLGEVHKFQLLNTETQSGLGIVCDL